MTHFEEIILDAILEKYAYSPGETVCGHVSVNLFKTTAVKTIKVLVKGYEHVSWMHKRSPCSEERKILSISKTLLGATGTQDLILDSGKHDFPFELQLPQGPLVSSFSGKHGHVYYMVHAVLKRPLRENQRVCRKLCILSDLDINVPPFISPVSQTCKTMVGWWFFTSGSISLTVSINRQGYCNGESIPIYTLIENRSSRLVVPKAVLYQIQTYAAQAKTKIIKQVVVSARGNPVPSDSSRSWNGNMIKIPPVSPSIFNSDILKVEYLLAVIVQIPGAKNLKVQLPVVIGTNGLGSQNFNMTRRSPVDFSLLYPTFTFPDEPEAPPSYAEVVSEERFEERRTSACQSQPDWNLIHPTFTYFQQFFLQPPPPYSEIYPAEQ